MDTPSKSQKFIQKGWADAPHITEAQREKLLAQFPEHQRDMRSKGDPMLGHGRIFDLSDDFVLCDPFEIPDHWQVICGLDFGWDHPQALAKIAYDIDSDTFYIVNSWKERLVSAANARISTKKWISDYPIAWPLDGLQGEKARTDSLQVKEHYDEAGFNMLFEHATWYDGSVSVESGIYDIITRARNGSFKIFRGQNDLMDEWRQYHRDEKGQVVKVKDDIIAAIRYAMMMIRFAVYAGIVASKTKVVLPEPTRAMGIRRNH